MTVEAIPKLEELYPQITQIQFTESEPPRPSTNQITRFACYLNLVIILVNLCNLRNLRIKIFEEVFGQVLDKAMRQSIDQAAIDDVVG